MAQDNSAPDPELEATVDKAIEAVRASREPEVSSQSEQHAQEAIESTEQSGDIESGTEAAAATSEPKPWFGDDEKELARSYGFGDDDLKDFADAKEFNRVTRLLDKQLLASVQPPPAYEPPPAPTPHKQNGHAATAHAPAPTSSGAEKPKFSKIDLAKLKEAGYDDETLGYLANQNALVEHLEALQTEREQEKTQIQALAEYVQQSEQRWQQVENQRRANVFHDHVDHLGDDRFGKVFDANGKMQPLTAEQDSARRKLWETVDTLKAGMAARGLEIPAESLLLRRARQVAFADDIAKAERAKLQKEITEQSKRRRPVQQARSAAGQFIGNKPLNRMHQSERIAAIAADPELQAKYAQYQEANGV